jgi:hypothetical protein
MRAPLTSRLRTAGIARSRRYLYVVVLSVVGLVNAYIIGFALISVYSGSKPSRLRGGGAALVCQEFQLVFEV